MYLIQKIICLSKSLIKMEKDESILQEGQELILHMMKLYHLTLELVLYHPEQKETQRIRRLFNRNPRQTASFINEEIENLQEEYMKGNRARQGKEDANCIRERYWQMAEKNLHYYQEMRNKSQIQKKGHLW